MVGTMLITAGKVPPSALLNVKSLNSSQLGIAKVTFFPRMAFMIPGQKVGANVPNQKQCLFNSVHSSFVLDISAGHCLSLDISAGAGVFLSFILSMPASSA